VADDFVRIEIGLDGGQILSALVTPASAETLDGALRSSSGDATVELQTEDGVMVLVVPRVLYVKRFARETRAGFAA
jgi:hypothetical protein